MRTFYLPTKVHFGRGCVAEYGEELLLLGKHALIVTGKSSAKCGALDDALSALSENGQDFTLFDRVKPNPTLACVREGLALLKDCGADFLLAIGGGSPMDCAKAIALLAVENRRDEEVFSGGYAGHALPMAHIPTTAGTGSEVTPYAILTNDFQCTKTSITSAALFPKIAFLDGRYTDSLPRDITVNTALDAFSHAAESLLSVNSEPYSAMYARECLSRLYPLLKRTGGELAENERDELLYCSMLAGEAIAQTGTTIVHGMGYLLTYFYGVPHGRANGLLLPETLKLCEERGLGGEIFRACNAGAAEIKATAEGLLGRREEIPRERLEAFAHTSMGNKNVARTAFRPAETDLRRIYLRSFGYTE